MASLRPRRHDNGVVPANAATDRGEDGFRQALRGELERGRRYCRPFAVVRVPLASASNGRGVRRRRRPTVASDLVRITDTVWAADDSLYLLLPESDRAAAELCVKRLGAFVDLVPGAAATVVFPDDGVTAGGLLTALDKAPNAASLGRWAGTWQHDRSNGSGRTEVS